MKIYTKTGDKGQTFLYGGKASTKSGKIIDLIGSLDELNSVVGVAASHIESNSNVKKLLYSIQSDIFSIGAYFAGDATQKDLNSFKRKTLSLEKQIDNFSEKLDPMRYFVLPGGSMSSAHLHHARTVCRRLERLLVSYLNDTNFLDRDADILSYINRLSDLLFICARYENKMNDVPDVPWISPKTK